MNLKEYLRAVRVGYNRESVTSGGHALLARADEELRPLLPAGLIVKASGGKGVATFTPWIGIFDPDETESPLQGIYVVYIFEADLRGVVLTLNQGVTRLREQLGDSAARARLRADATQVRNALGETNVAGLADEVSFGSAGQLQRAYEAGNIAGLRYSMDNLPAEEQMRQDLVRFLRLYQDAIQAKRQLLQATPGAVASASVEQTTSATDPLRDFKPKSDSDYRAQLSGRAIVKTRRHETLVREYGLFAQSQGLNPATTVHPRDMTLHREGVEWLVEAKVLYHGNASNAVREAIGQLFSYAHFLYAENPPLLALFSEPIGDAFTALLESLGIAAIWKDTGEWQGSASAVKNALVNQPLDGFSRG